MKYKLAVVDGRLGHGIVWIDEDGDYGASLGDSEALMSKSPDAVDDDDRDHYVASVAAKSSRGVAHDGYHGFYWESSADASAALRAARAALKNKPLNEHEKWCLAAGWKPPNGRM